MLFFLFGCEKAEVINVNSKIIQNENVEYINNQKFVICENSLFDNVNVYILKNQSEGQMLSIVVIDDKKNAMVIDGGRKEDAEFLYNFLNEKSDLKIESWFLTHCHDDHVGALYEIIDKYKENILIKNIYYKFPDFSWLYNLIGNDAGGVVLVDDQIKNYSKYINKKYQDENICILHNDLQVKNIINITPSINIEIMNNMYMIEEDSLNNSSIVYKINILKNNSEKELEKYISMIVLGDLSYDGGKKILEERNDDLKSEICVLAHHGQGGVWKEVYEKINPMICIWPTTKKIYENIDKKYHTDDVKQWLIDIGVEKQYNTIENNLILK